MISSDKQIIRIAILDLYEGHDNQGMRCIHQIINEWCDDNRDRIIEKQVFDVRLKNELPDTSFDIYISSGGPGDPLSSRYDDWDISWCKWLSEIRRWNEYEGNTEKKHVFFICHSFQMACRELSIGTVCKRKSTSFGVFPMHMMPAGRVEPVFSGLQDPFYAVDSRDYQVINPNHSLIKNRGGHILCIEKDRPHVPYERAVMGVRFNEYMIGTQFHPEADAPGMSLHLQKEDRKKTVIENHGEAKLISMLDQLNDPDKIVWTYAHVLPNFLNHAIGQLEPAMASA